MTNPSTRARIVGVSIVLPLLLAVAAAVITASWLGELPATVAVHWGTGAADGFGSPWVLVLLPLAAAVPFTALAAAASWRPGPTGRPSVTQKILLATAPALAALLAVVSVGSLGIQRGLADPTTVPTVLPWVLVGLAASGAVFAAAWFVLPAADRSPARGTRAEPLAVAPTSVAYWSRTVTFAPPVWVLLGSVLVLAAVVAGLVAVVAPAAIGIGVAVILIVGVSMLLTGAWRVTADRRGLVVRGILGVPVFRVLADDIADVRLVDVHPTADFGGWGVRVAPGRRTGVVLRAGEAIEVVRRDGRSLTVTVDDAATGAGVLAALRVPLR
jgi:hypothetical protein